MPQTQMASAPSRDLSSHQTTRRVFRPLFQSQPAAAMLPAPAGYLQGHHAVGLDDRARGRAGRDAVRTCPSRNVSSDNDSRNCSICRTSLMCGSYPERRPRTASIEPCASSRIARQAALSATVPPASMKRENRRAMNARIPTSLKILLNPAKASTPLRSSNCAPTQRPAASRSIDRQPSPEARGAANRRQDPSALR